MNYEQMFWNKKYLVFPPLRFALQTNVFEIKKNKQAKKTKQTSFELQTNVLEIKKKQWTVESDGFEEGSAFFIFLIWALAKNL